MKVMRKTKSKMQRTAVIIPMNNNIFNIFLTLRLFVIIFLLSYLSTTISKHFLGLFLFKCSHPVPAPPLSRILFFSLVDLHQDRVHYTFKQVHLGLNIVQFGQLILVEPTKSLPHSFLNNLLVTSCELVLELLFTQTVLHVETMLLNELSCCFNLLTGDGGLVGLVLFTYIQGIVGINVKWQLNLWNNTRGSRIWYHICKG